MPGYAKELENKEKNKKETMKKRKASHCYVPTA